MECTGITIFDLDTLKPVIVTSVKTKQSHTHGKRLKAQTDVIDELREKYPPTIVTIERGFSRFNNATQVVYRVHGVINRIFWDIEQIYYPPKSVKEAIVSGNASKLLVQAKILKEFELDFDYFQNEDESDSFAVALTYLIKNDMIKWKKGLAGLKPYETELRNRAEESKPKKKAKKKAVKNKKGE